MDDSGWELWLNWPAEEPRQVTVFPTPEAADTAAKRLYGDEPALRELAEAYGLDPAAVRWRIRDVGAY
ncbi:hypothetical protein [Micromonospora sp. WMMA2032]|uniref:hypothetical protein n=1 Tax=Micromonospora sp. WMMA2032 TaxID=2039870 RepID=UPI0012FD995A|nr:hypothetical protein [Micromonospora sp. WMMA2032]